MIAKIIHYLSLIALSFLTGAVLVFFNLPPQPMLQRLANSGALTAKELARRMSSAPLDLMLPLTFEDTGWKSIAPEKKYPGATLLLSVFDDQMTTRLYAQDGTLIHQWPIDFFEIPFEGKTTRYQALIHGVHLYPDGSLLANLEGSSLLKVSRCGEIIWRTDGRSHHSIFLDDEGLIWTPILTTGRVRPTISSEQTEIDGVAAFDPLTGEKLVHIELAEVLTDAGYEGIVTGNILKPSDVLHTNDVEVLSQELADGFEDFEAGDILVNARNQNQLWVIDGKSHKLKWWMTGPMSGAHDPDFQPGGRITILDNRHKLNGEITTDRVGQMGGSRILEIEPKERTVRTVFATNEHTTFFTGYRGKHQFLPNGNILIAEADGGRALEVTSEGELVWQFVNAYDEKSIFWMIDAIRVPSSYARAFDEPCPNT